MKRVFAIFLVVVFMFAITSCGDPKTIDGITYDTYGLISAKDDKNPEVEYKTIWGNVVWGVILVETIVAPIYFFGFSMFEPVGKLDPTKPKGAIACTSGRTRDNVMYARNV